MSDEKKNRSYLDKDIKLLWGLAAARCAYPGCRILCIAEGTALNRSAIFGKIAHIVAHSDSGPRADLDYPKELRDRYENLILLCGNHHDIVDTQHNSYTVDDLHAWKKIHEEWVKTSLKAEIHQVNFAELEVVTKALLGAAMSPVQVFEATPVLEKMERNQISPDNLHIISIGMMKVREVGNYVGHVALVDPDFPERLKGGFVKEYQNQRDQGFRGDELFDRLHQFASGYSSNFKRSAAGLAILVYLFEKCEVFEP